MAAMFERLVPVRWRDTDAQGHVNHAVFLTYLEEGRDAFYAHAIGADPNYVVVRIEMDLRAEHAAERELDHAQLQTSETMLRKMFEASPDNIAVNSLADGRFIAVNDEYQVAGYTRDDVIGNSIIALGMWPDERQMDLFLEKINSTGRVKNMEITQRRKDG